MTPNDTTKPDTAGRRENNPRSRTYQTLALITLLAIATSWVGWATWEYVSGPTIDETASVTVVAHYDGYVTRHKRRFRHLVRLENGVEYRMEFGELYPIGSRLHVNFRRYVSGDAIQVTFYRRIVE